MLMRLGSIIDGVKAKKDKEGEKKPMKCFFYNGLHRMQDSPKRSKLSVMSKEEKAEPNESKTSKLGSTILTHAKRNNI